MSQIPTLPQISSARGGGLLPSPRSSPRKTGAAAGTPHTLAGTGGPLVLSSTSRTKYVIASPTAGTNSGLYIGGVSPRGMATSSNSTALTVVGGNSDSSDDGTQQQQLVVANQQQLTTIPNPPQNVTIHAPATMYTNALSNRPSQQNGANAMLTPVDMRGIGNLVTFNSKLRHKHRSINAAAAIPSLTFATRLKGPCDDVTGLQVASVNPQESALDVVLRLTSPEAFRIPALSDPKTTMPLTSRLVALLKGTNTSVPMHWEGEKEGVELDHTHVQQLKDAKMRIEAAKRQEDPLNEGKSRCSLAALYYNSRNMEGVIKTLSPAVNLFELAGHVAGLAFTHNILGVSYYHNGEYKMALVHFRKQEALCGAYGKSLARINMGVCYAALDEPQYSQQAFADALTSALEAQESVLETIATGNKGLAYMRLGQMRLAQTELEACLEHCSIAGDHVGTVVVLLLLGQNSSACKDYEQAIFYFEHAMRVAEQCNCTPLLMMAKVSIGVCRGQAGSKGELMVKASTMGKPLSVADVVCTMAQNE